MCFNRSKQEDEKRFHTPLLCFLLTVFYEHLLCIKHSFRSWSHEAQGGIVPPLNQVIPT